MHITLTHNSVINFQKYSSLKNSQHSPISNGPNPSFKSSLSDDLYIDGSIVKHLADKYKHVKNPFELIWQELTAKRIPKIHRFFYCRQILDRIEEYKNESKLKKQKLVDLDTNIVASDKRVNEIEEETGKMLDKIAKIQIEKVVDRLKLNKILMQEKRKKQVFSELHMKYIDLFKLEEKIFPNGIMIKGMDEKSEQEQVLNYLRNNGCEVYRLDFSKIPINTVAKDINALSKSIKNSGTHSLIAIDNFDKYTVCNDKNFNFIQQLKGFLCDCAKKYNTTVLVFESHPEKLDENIIGRHRFQKEIDVRGLNIEKICEFIPKYDGYTLIYNDDENAMVDLYLGNFGHNRNTLWVDSEEPEKILAVIDRIDKIKKLDRFNNIHRIQCPQPQNPFALNGFHALNECTKEYKKVYEKNI